MRYLLTPHDVWMKEEVMGERVVLSGLTPEVMIRVIKRAVLHGY